MVNYDNIDVSANIQWARKPVQVYIKVRRDNSERIEAKWRMYARVIELCPH